MFRCKRDVDRHVADLEERYKSESERVTKYFTVARLYFQVGEPDIALKFVDKYCEIWTSSALAYKLRGQIFETLVEKGPVEQSNVNKGAALEAYKSSYELDLKQKELLIKICELMSQLPIRDSEKARYWADQAEKQFPRNQHVRKLRDKMKGSVEFNGNGNNHPQSSDASPSSQQEDEIEADNSILWSTTRGQGTSFTTLNGSYRVEDYLNSTPGRPGNGNNTTPARRFPPRPSPERLANQIRNVESTQEKIVASMAENSRCLLETQEAILVELRKTREEYSRGIRENTEAVKDLRSEVNSIWRDVRDEMRRVSSQKQDVVVVKQEAEKAPAGPKPLTAQDLAEALSFAQMSTLSQMSLAGLYAPAPRHPLPNMAGVMNPMSMHSASPPHPRPAMMNPAAVQLPPNPVVAPVASVNNWPTNTPAPTQPLPQQQGGGPPVNVVVTSSVRIPTSVDASPSPALAPVTIPREHLAKPVATEAATALATTSASTTPSRPHNYQINIPQNSPEAKDPFAGKEGPAVPITTSAILASIPAPKFSAVSSKTTTAASASPKPKMAVSASVTTSTTSSSSSQKSNNFGNQFKLKPGAWDCSGCYSRQAADTIQCPACQTTKPGHEDEVKAKEEASKAKEEANKPSISFGAGGGFKFNLPPSASTPTTTVSSTKEEPAKPSPFSGFTGFGGFGTSTPSSTVGATTSSPSSGFSFSSIQSIVSSTPATSTINEVQSTNQPEAEEADEGHDDSANHDPHFEPIIPLPELVEVKTGEEDEEVKFVHRSKVYRWDPDTKEWKERGVGDLKILYHPNRKTYRVLLRRDQVHKIACNHYITVEMTLEPMNKSETAITWFAMDFSEEDRNADPKLEKLAARFKLAETKDDFVKAFEAAQEDIKARKDSGSHPEVDEQEEVIDVGSGVQEIQNTVADAGGDFELTFEGQGLKLISAADAKGVVDKINSTRNFTTLTFSGNTVGIDAAEAIGKALENHSELKYAHWKDMFTGRMKSEIAPALKHLSGGVMKADARLVELDISDNALGPMGMPGINDLLKSPSCFNLQELKLNNTGCGVTGGKALSKTLLECHTASKGQLALKVFILGRSRQENEGAIALAQVFKLMGSLEVVEMPQNGIYYEGLSALADAFVNNPNLRILNMSDNTFNKESPKSMADALEKLQKLEVLNLGDCLLKTEGARFIAYAIKNSHPNLREWNMESNEIRLAGGIAIVDAIQNKNHLQKLNLDGNHFGAQGCQRILKKLTDLNKRDVLDEIEDDEEPEDEEEEINPGGNDDDENDHEINETAPIQNLNFSFASSGSNQSTIFKPTTSISTGTESIFGKSTTTSSSNSIFGGGSASASPSLFGGGGSTFGSNTSGSIFGNLNKNSSAAAAPTSGIFGQSPSSGTTSNIFGGGSKPNESTPATGIFGGTVTKPENLSSGIDLSASKNLASFADLGSGGGFSFGKKTEGFSFAGTGASVFGGGQKQQQVNISNTENDDADEDGTNHDPHFEPIIPLPELVQVTTGEEDEEVLFKHRAKVYRFDKDTKEWKERGVGDIKILHHVKRMTYRILLRRDQIHKIACNHYITTEQQLEPMQSSETALTWFAMDFTDDPSGQLEKLAVRFKLPETKEEFKKAFETAQIKLKTNPPPPNSEDVNAEDADDDDDDYEDEETAEDDQSEETDNTMFERECDLYEISSADSKSETKLGRALLKIIYDDDVYGARIIAVKISEAAGNGNGGGEIENEDETYLCNHIIAVQTNLDVDEDRNRCSWSAFDFSDDPPTYRTFAAEFSQSESTDEAQAEFVSVFQEGKELAEQGEILEQPMNAANLDPPDYYGQGGTSTDLRIDRTGEFYDPNEDDENDDED